MQECMRGTGSECFPPKQAKDNSHGASLLHITELDNHQLLASINTV
jgi:hypothetical protein